MYAISEYTKGNYITAEMFGAVGDGVNDDTIALQTAFENSGEIPILLCGKYKITQTINLHSNLVVQGDGHIICDAITAFKGENISNVLIENITFNSNATIGDSYSIGYTLYFLNCNSIDINKCSFNNIKTISAICTENCTDIIIHECNINNYVYAGIILQNGIENAKIINNSVLECLAYATQPLIANSYPISISCSNQSTHNHKSNNILCAGNYIKNSVPHWEGIDAHGCSNSIISNNIIINCLTGIAIVNGTETENVVISNNICKIENTEYTLEVSKNNFGIVIVGSNENPHKNISIYNNIVESFGNTLDSSIAENGCGGIEIAYAHNVNIANNTVVNCGVIGIIITRNAYNVKITNNIIKEVIKRTSVSYGILVTSIDNYVYITGNTIYAETTLIDRGIWGSTNTPSYTSAFNNQFIGEFTYKYGSFSRMIAEVMPAPPTGYRSTVGKIGDIIKLQSISNGIYGYICTGDGDGNTVESTWQALSIVT